MSEPRGSRRVRVVTYLGLAIALLWVPWALALTWPTMRPVLAFLGPYSPALAAVLVRLIGREGFADAHLGIRGVPLGMWGVAVALPLVWNLAQDLMLVGLGLARVEWSHASAGLYRIPINLFGGVIVFIGEELGWRSYLLERLRPLGRPRALLLSSVAWSLWHAPMVFGAGAYSGAVTSVGGGMLSLAVIAVLGFIFGWVYLDSGSVWPVVLMHSCNNLVSMKLLREAWIVPQPPGLATTAALGLVSIGAAWLVLLACRRFSEPHATKR